MEFSGASVLASTIPILTFAVLVFCVAVSDILTFTVPNRWCAAIAVLYPAHALAAHHPGEWLPAFAVAGVVLVLGYALFAVRAWGGGDAKLFAAVALWAGPDLILSLLLVTTLAGGVMALFIWLQYRIASAPVWSMALYSRVPQNFGQQKMPYAAAIAVGALYVAFTLLRIS